MKLSLRLVSLITLGCMVLAGVRSNAFAGGQIPLAALAGTYAETGSGSQAFCHDINGPIDCGTFDPSVDFLETFQFLDQAVATIDNKGNSCSTHTTVINDLPVDQNPLFSFTQIHADTLIDYDPTAGAGDIADSGYVGGSCNGASFNSSGATLIGTATVHFSASDNGKRIDYLVTAVNGVPGQTNDAGGNAASEVGLKR